VGFYEGVDIPENGFEGIHVPPGWELGEGGVNAAVIEKARKDAGLRKKAPAGEVKHWELDPLKFDASYLDEDQSGNTHQGTAGVTYMMLTRMSRVPFVSAVLGTRISQIAAFCRAQESDRQVGWRIRMRDKERSGNKSHKKRIQEITDLVSQCGHVGVHDDPFWTVDRFLRMIWRDSLSYDQATWENVRTRGGELVGWVPVDATTMRRAKITEAERLKGRRTGEVGYHFAQVVADRIVATFDQSELVFGIRRPRTSIYANGYGFPELEELIGVVTNLIDAQVYNANNFRHGTHTSGVLAVVSAMEPATWRNFKRDFYSMLSGAYNAKKTALLQLDPEAKEDIKSINMSQNNREMEYGQWISWLLRIVCAIYLMDPAELGYQYGNEGQTSSLSSSGPAERIIASRERGLLPQLRQFETWINRGTLHLLPHGGEDYVFEFTGFQAQSEKDRLSDLISRGKCFLSLNEIRALEDKDDLEVDYSDPATWPLDATFHQTANQLRQEQAEEEQGGEEGPEGEDGGEGGQPDWQSMFGGFDGEEDEGTDGAEGQDDAEGLPEGREQEGDQVEKGQGRPRVRAVSVIVE
jgi:hypothetical protein